tara:strand:- start:67 stop:462 length:396 start_codon:yes stop_codon:yes gene_type:complete
MDKAQAWAKIKSLCPDIEPSDKLAWKLRNTWILSNQAVQRIAAYNKILVTYTQPAEVLGNIYVKATAENTITGLKVETFGESSSKNTQANYPLAMAEKRAHDRAVLKCVDVYSDFYSEQEADEFKQNKKED